MVNMLHKLVFSDPEIAGVAEYGDDREGIVISVKDASVPAVITRSEIKAIAEGLGFQVIDLKKEGGREGEKL